MPEVNPTCPKCGAEMFNRSLYCCGSQPANNYAQFHQSPDCRIRELEQANAWLRKALEEIRDNPGLRSQLRLMAGKVLEETK